MGIFDSLFGSTTSTTTYSSLNTTLSSLIATTLQKCSTLITMSQTIAVSGSGNTVSGNTLTQQVQYTQNCPQLAQNISQLQADMSTAIQQATTATGQIIQLSSTSTDTNTEIRNQVSNAVNITSMNEIMATLNQAQVIVVSGTGNTVDNNVLSQTTTAVASASQKVLNSISAVSDYDVAASQSSTSTTQNPFQFLADIFSGSTMLYILIIICVLVFAKMMYPSKQPQSARIEGGSPYVF